MRSTPREQANAQIMFGLGIAGGAFAVRYAGAVAAIASGLLCACVGFCCGVYAAFKEGKP